MRLLAWRSAREWSRWHIDHLGQPLCGARMLEPHIATAYKPARPSDWAKTCDNCKEIALRAATGPIDVDLPAPEQRLALTRGNP